MARAARIGDSVKRSRPQGLLLLAALALMVGFLTPAAAGARSQRSIGTPEQVAWVRSAAGNFISAELAGNGAGACGILAAPLRGTFKGRTCVQRWDAKLARMLHTRGERHRLRMLLTAAVSARVVVHGNGARIYLPGALIDSANRFRWAENCWMLSR